MDGSVLLISRDGSLGSNIARHVRKRNWSVANVSDGQDAVKMITEKEIDAVLMVLKGLEKEGLKIFRQLNRISPLTETITINNSGEVNLSIKFMKAGVFDDLHPPLDMAYLLEMLQKAADRKKAFAGTQQKRLSRFDRMMMAISFAEAGETETARTYLTDVEKREKQKWIK